MRNIALFFPGATKWSNSRQLALFRQAAAQIAAESGNAVPVLWVVDSFDILLRGISTRAAIASIFQLSEAAVVLPVASSATVVADLFKGARALTPPVAL